MGTFEQLKEEFLFGDETYQIIGAAMAVHRELGYGFLEAVYWEALAQEFTDRQIPFFKEQASEIQYKGKPLNKIYFADFLCHDQVITELKAMEAIHIDHLAQVCSIISKLRIYI